VETGLYGVVLDEDSLPVEGAEVYAVSLGEEFDFADDSSAEDAGWFEDVEEVPGEPVLTNSDGSNAPLRERPAGKA
jgi:hypothetical protein